MPIEDNGILITNAVEKANMYAQQIENVSKLAKQRCIYNFDKDLRCAVESGREEGYNSNITMEELRFAFGSA